MVGVELKASWVQTRKCNGDIIQTRISNTIGAWKSGKFMDLSCRPWSINTFALSKVWFKCHTVDLRVLDITSISSKVKSWLFQDQLEKPQEMILFRPINMGGLGLHNVKYKALASFIRTFLETAANPKFKHSLYHSTLYRIHVLGDDSIPLTLTLPPYFPPSFFQIIKEVRDNTPLNVATMTCAQWYRLLVEQEVTMTEGENNTMSFIRSRAELSSPSTDWEATWGRARLKGLGSGATSFLWKLLHQLLPTEERLARILPNSEPTCKLCSVPANADLKHSFFGCDSTREVGGKLLSTLAQFDSDVTPDKLLRLEFECEPDLEMPLVWVTAQTLAYMWSIRCSGKTVDPTLTRASLETKISLLRETRFTNEHVLIREIIENNM